MKRLSTLLAFALATSITHAENTLLIDKDLSPYSGSANLLTMQRTLIKASDSIFKSKDPDKNSGLKIVGRTVEQSILWLNIGNLTSVTQHEIFGHGYRLRELGLHPISYQITPWSGSTSFTAPLNLPAGEETAITVAGLESEAIMAHDMKMDWLRSGQIDGRLAPTYMQAAQSVVWYTSTLNDLGANDELTGNDVSSYVFQLNQTYPNHHYSSRKMKNISYYNLVDPMTYYAYVAFFYYIGTGHSWNFPLIPIKKNIKYLPNLRVGYAPYAPETYLENFLVVNGEPIYFYGKGSSRSYGGGAAYDKLWSYDKGNVGFKFDFWNQHRFITSATIQDFETPGNGCAYRPALKERIWGAQLSATGTMKMQSDIKLYAEIGAKSAGYLPGYSLGDEVVARIGLKF